MSPDQPQPEVSCQDLEQLAPELGLGVLSGMARAAALAHADRCAPCRSLIADMTEVGDAILQLGPEAEPPVGFETRVWGRRQSQIAAPVAARSRWRWAAGAAAAAVVAAGVGAGLGTGLAGGSGPRVAHAPAFAALGARDVRAAPLRRYGREVGQVFAYSGSPSWVFMTVSAGWAPQRVTCELVTRAGRRLDVGTFTVATGYWSSWGATIPVHPGSISRVELVAPGGTVVSSATL